MFKKLLRTPDDKLMTLPRLVLGMLLGAMVAAVICSREPAKLRMKITRIQ